MSSISFEVSTRCDTNKVRQIYYDLSAEKVFVTWRANESINCFREMCIKLAQLELNRRNVKQCLCLVCNLIIYVMLERAPRLLFHAQMCHLLA